MMMDRRPVVSRAIEGVARIRKASSRCTPTTASRRRRFRRTACWRSGAAPRKDAHLRDRTRPAQPLAWLRAHVMRKPGEWVPHLEEAIEDSYDRLLNPSIQTEVRLELKDRSDEEAIRVFRENLENLLLSPPAGALNVLAIDPGMRTGCKIAVVDDTGKFLEHSVIYPFEPKNDLVGSANDAASADRKYNVQAIAIGNGTARAKRRPSCRISCGRPASRTSSACR